MLDPNLGRPLAGHAARVRGHASGVVVRSGRSLGDVLRSNRDARPASLELHGGGRWILAGDRLHDVETLALRTVAPSSTAGEWKGLSCGGAKDVVLLYDEIEAWDDDERLLSPAADPELRLLDVDRKTVRRSRSLSSSRAPPRRERCWPRSTSVNSRSTRHTRPRFEKKGEQER
jgi:hypothetical protein